MSDDTQKPDKLTVKQQLFVKELVSNPTQTQKEALVAAGYRPTTPESAKKMAAELFHKPKIQNALSNEIEKRYPDLPGKVADLLYNGLSDPGIKFLDKLQAVKLFAQIQGWLAPTKHASVHVTKTIDDQFKLPGDE